MNKHLIRFAKRAVLLFGLASASMAWAASGQAYWHDDAGRPLSADAPSPTGYRALRLDTAGIAAYLKEAHGRGIATNVSLPQPDGGFAEFLVTDSGTMPSEMQQKYPDIISLKGNDGQGRPVRLDVSPMGFQAMVFDPAGLWIVRPETLGGGDRYISFKRAGLAVPAGEGTCEVQGSHIDPAGLDLVQAPMTQTGIKHKVYRTAVAANHQYIASVGGGTVAGGLAATIMAVNRVTQVYEYEMSIQLTLVPNNDLIMYPSATGDPFGANGTGVINNSTSVINAAIGAANYDLGHVFTTGSGGVAGLGVVCGSSKARGTTGLPNPTGDSFYIDFVAHEMGHQFGGNHPFNGNQGNCSGGNRNGSTAYEPGSGTTIMAYAGICGADDLQPHSDPFFHAISLQEITNYSNGGGNCAVAVNNSNVAPVIDTAGLPTGLTIPANTPFVLTGSATDADAQDSLTYDWEQWDLGPANPLSGGDIGSGPIFRSFSPTVSGSRMFPSLSTILTGVPVKGNILPTTTRVLKFRLTARDNRPGAGTSQSADISLNVTNTAGPFVVTAPNTALSWPQSSTQSVTWNVANTNVAPVNCATVDITMSSDGGQTFPYTLATGVPNSGTASITVPSIATTKGRVSVSCASNLFFDVSNADFTIPAGAGTFTVGGTLSGLAGTQVVLQINGSNNLVVVTNGAFTFPGPLATGAPYAVTVVTQPASPTQTCTVSNGSGTIGSSNVTNVTVACVTPPPQTFTIGGTVTALTGSGLVLKLNGANNLPIAANGSFTFPAGIASGSGYSVTVGTQPTGPAQTCTVINGSGAVGTANVTNVQVDCGGAGATFTVGGTVSGLAGSGLVLALNGGTNLPVSANGSFTFPGSLAAGATYAVTVSTQPTSPTQNCTVANGNGTIGSSNVTNVAVTCTTPPTTYTVGGTVSGLAASGLVLTLNGANSLPVSANGTFTFPTALSIGQNYVVAIGTQPSPQTCTVSNGSGSIGTSNVTNVIVTCAGAATFTVGGTVSGLTGSGLVLSLNGSSVLPVAADGAFTFADSLTTGASYSVTVTTQPTAPAQTCTVVNGSGTIATANVTNIAVTCTAAAVDLIFADGFEGSAQTCAPTQLFADPGFEIGAGSDGAWTSVDSKFGTAFCDASCDDNATIVARTGDWFVWFGGTDQQNTSTLAQSVVFPAGQPRWLNYWLINEIAGDPTATLTITIDGATVLNVVGGDTAGEYVAQTFEVPAQYLDGASHAVQFNWSADGGANASAIMDDITLDCSAQSTRLAPHVGRLSAALRRHAR
ncbi:MAG: reprolysin-like metallopeptidase [Dokdonella sp.]|uniref:reprolysin-like metallopeptidase n=1 Tax=Dokdonella sp. TaxID=2291710 RepID=UPI0032665693